MSIQWAEEIDMMAVGEKDLTGRKVTVIGAARSGVGVAQLLKKNGACVFISDQSSADKLRAQIVTIESMEIDIETGGHSDRVYDADMIVLSPGVPSTAAVKV